MKNRKGNVRRRNFVFAFRLMSVFTVFYFGSAILTTAGLKEIAGIMILGTPLAIWAGFVTILVGLILARICLVKGGEN